MDPTMTLAQHCGYFGTEWNICVLTSGTTTNVSDDSEGKDGKIIPIDIDIDLW